MQISVDDGPWQPATLGAVATKETWAQWRFDWAATPGKHTVAVHAIDSFGVTQTAERRAPDPDGATGHHTIRVEVR